MASEEWQFNDLQALTAPRRGLAESRARQFAAAPPDLTHAKQLADSIDAS